MPIVCLSVSLSDREQYNATYVVKVSESINGRTAGSLTLDPTYTRIV